MLSRIAAFAALAFVFVAPSLQAQELCGRWHGCWVDTKTGHKGHLNARFEYCGNDQYHVVFTGDFFKVIPFRFATNLCVTGRDGDKILLSGTSQLPFVGAFTYNAWATACTFECDFCSSRWTGRFSLSR